MKRLKFLFCVFLLYACDDYPERITVDLTGATDGAAAKLKLNGPASDTAYLNAAYYDPGVTSYYETGNKIRCNEKSDVKVTGYVDTRFSGAYVISYAPRETSNDTLALLSRTVHVIENKAAFLNGHYDVAYTCTAVIRGAFTPSFTSSSYSANVRPSDRNYSFDLDVIKIGDEYLKPTTSLQNNTIEVSVFSTILDYRSTSSGSLSSSKNSFTIETIAYQYNPPVNYVCKNIYTQVKLREIKK